MSHADYFAWLYEVGTGWLGYTPDLVLGTPPARILVAFKGHVKKLEALHGDPRKRKPDKPSAALHRARMDAIAAKSRAIFNTSES